MAFIKTRRLIVAIILLFVTFPLISLAEQPLVLFQGPQTAQTHCLNDEVVWLNLPMHIWHSKWQRWYGRTKNGAYVCKTEAAANGNRASLRG